MRARLLVWLASVVPAFNAEAQAVRIRVVDEQANAPVAGALVSLKRAGRTLTERLTNAQGQHVVSAPPDTGYLVEIRRVGFQPFVSSKFEIPATDTQALELRVPWVRAVVKASPPQSHRAECRAGDSGRSRAGELWQQMRTALASLEIARVAQLERLAVSRYERTLNRSGEELSMSTMSDVGMGNRPFRTAPAAELSRTGFMVTDRAGQPTFRAPDAEVLLSDEFAADHCFDVVNGTGPTEGMIGLSFAPTPSRRVTDVQGVLWADVETAQLRLAEFSYRFSTPGDAKDAGGRILFEQLTSSTWIAREWVVRMPVLMPSGQIVGYREEGGEAMVVTSRMAFVMDSVAASRKPPGIVTGFITDSLTGKGFAGARVWLDSAGPQSYTDPKGLYFLRGVPPGQHIVRFSHPTLDSIGVTGRGAIVNVKSEAMVDANLAGPSLRTLVGASCGDTMAVMTGVVRDAAKGSAVDSAHVTLTWIDLQLGADRRPVLIMPRETVASTDGSGRYGACVRAGVEITAFAQRGVARTARIDAMTEERRLGIVDLNLDLSATDTLSGDSELRGIVKYQDGTPLTNAIVTLSDPEITASTDSAGRFRIRAIPGGTRAVDARAIGHAPQRQMVEVKPGGVTEVSIYMRKVTMLDPILVRAAADDRSAATLAALADRQRRHQGIRLSPSQLRAFADARLDGVLRSLPYARLRTTPGYSLTMQDTQGRECRPTVWLDGHRSDVGVIVNIRTRDVMSFEVMRMKGEVPIEYQDFANCGAVLVWLNPAR